MPLESQATFKGEIPLRDFTVGIISDADIADTIEKVGIFNTWLHETVGGGFQWAGGKDFEDHARELADYFNAHVNNPYYIHQHYINTRDVLSFVFFERADAEAFVQKFGESHHYKLEEKGFEKNQRILALWSQKIGWVPQDERLKPYVEQALTL